MASLRPPVFFPLLLSVLLLAANPGCLAQDSRPASTLPATAAPDGEPTRGSLTAALSYGSNSAFFGRTQTTAFPYLSTELTYTAKTGFWGSVLAYDLLNTATLIDETDLSAGWDGDLTDKFDASLSYSRFFFAHNSPLVKSSVNNSLDAYLGYDLGVVYTRLNAAYLFGSGSQDFFLILDNSRYFSIDKVFTDKGYLTIEPRLSLTAGTQYFAETSALQQIQRGNKGKGKGSAGGTATISSSRFSLLSYELRLPLTYHLGKVAAEAAYRYLQPVNVLPEDDSAGRSYFTGSLFVTF